MIDDVAAWRGSRVDRSTVPHICRVTKQGALDALAASVPALPGQTPEAAALAEAREEIERLRATLGEDRGLKTT